MSSLDLMDYILSLEDTPDPADVRAVQEGVQAYNRRYAPDENYRSLAILLRAPDGSVAGGLLGETYWGWLHVAILWVRESARGRGFGSRLMAMAEEEARRRGCRYADLDTFSFQALPFYRRLGYVVFGVLDDHPPGHMRYFLKKDLR